MSVITPWFDLPLGFGATGSDGEGDAPARLGRPGGDTAKATCHNYFTFKPRFCLGRAVAAMSDAWLNFGASSSSATSTLALVDEAGAQWPLSDANMFATISGGDDDLKFRVDKLRAEARQMPHY